MISIRSFRNYDAPVVARLWNDHRSSIGIESPVGMTTLEVIVLGRPFFTENSLLTACDGAEVVGYIHWVLSAEDPKKAVIAAVAVAGRADRDAIAGQLIESAMQAAKQAGAVEVLLGKAPEHWTGYDGLGRSGSTSGILENDVAVRRWASASGFRPARELVSLALMLASYRPAIDRDLLALRRSASVDRRRDVTDQPFRIASAMSHLEVHRFVASERSGSVIADADLLVGDPEMMIVSGGTVLLSRWRSRRLGPGLLNPSAAAAAIRLVLTSAISELVAERITKIQATIEANNQVDADALRTVGFDVEHRGTIFQRTI